MVSCCFEAIYLLSSPLARGGGGCWGAERGVPGAAFVVRSRTAGAGGCGAWWAEGSGAGPAGPASFSVASVRSGLGRGPRTPGSPGSRPPRPRCLLPTPVPALSPAHGYLGGWVCVLKTGCLRRDFRFVEFKFGKLAAFGRGRLVLSAHLGSRRNPMGFDLALPLKVGGRMTPALPENRVPCHPRSTHTLPSGRGA